MSIFVQRMGIVDSIISVYDANVNANTGADLFNFGGALSEKSVTGSPTAGSGVLSINSNSVGAYDFMILNGPLTPNQATVDSWIEATADTRSAWIVIIGDLTIGAGVTMTPSVRKLMMVLFVTGDLVLAGEISMSQRGANHSATTAVAIAVYTGITIGATGGATVAGVNSSSIGNDGNVGANGAAGGGGSGANSVTIVGSGGGAAGTCFSGGPGGGSESSTNSPAGEAGAANGGKGGDGNGTASWSGGAGNPGGDGAGNGSNGSDGTGGTLSIFCLGDFSGNGSITAAGANGGNATSTVGGGGSGGGVVTLYVGTDSSTITPTALGGVGGTASLNRGGHGGAGSVQTGLIV